ncbi:hypothetical protein CIPAW_05G165100 [Carya illinoinensis]|uniref:Uncharacterized protein n=1 Tax=Carya illinoinensis TaxID=32201 RepID=A0A8T1QK07_CARIL|nr:hypothetical protein CIPAW_05G165100 [Carya illinoinensis]
MQFNCTLHHTVALVHLHIRYKTHCSSLSFQMARIHYTNRKAIYENEIVITITTSKSDMHIIRGCMTSERKRMDPWSPLHQAIILHPLPNIIKIYKKKSPPIIKDEEEEKVETNEEE